jgi:hypothetical protein
VDDIEFFDLLYQGWSKTTGAETTFWMPEQDEYGNWDIFAVDQEQNKTVVGMVASEEDAAWITALHGCFADLVRRLHQAVDEAERFDCEKDQVISEMAELIEQLEGYKQRYG